MPDENEVPLLVVLPLLVLVPFELLVPDEVLDVELEELLEPDCVPLFELVLDPLLVPLLDWSVSRVMCGSDVSGTPSSDVVVMSFDRPLLEEFELLDPLLVLELEPEDEPELVLVPLFVPDDDCSLLCSPTEELKLVPLLFPLLLDDELLVLELSLAELELLLLLPLLSLFDSEVLVDWLFPSLLEIEMLVPDDVETVCEEAVYSKAYWNDSVA